MAKRRVGLVLLSGFEVTHKRTNSPTADFCKILREDYRARVGKVRNHGRNTNSVERKAIVG